MTVRHESKPCRSGGTSADWIVHELHADGRTAQIKCYCYGEAVAKEIAEALNVMDAINKAIVESRP